MFSRACLKRRAAFIASSAEQNYRHAVQYIAMHVVSVRIFFTQP